MSKLIYSESGRYSYKRTDTEWPWRYIVYNRNHPVTVTVTKWGAKRLIRKMEEIGE